MYEKCAGGLLDALVIVQYMHVLYIDKTCGVHAIAAYQWESGGDDRQSITGNDKHK